MQIATVSAKFQILLPKKIREQMHIKAGQQFIFIQHGDSLQLVPKRDIKEMKGILAGANVNNIRDRDDRI